MSITILHSPFNEASRAFLAALGFVPQGDDMTININGTAVRIVSNHEVAAGIAGFGDYPALVYAPGEAVYVLNRPESWQQCLAFMDAPWGPEGPAAPASSTTMSKYTFLRRFTGEELARATTLKLQGDIQLHLAQTLLDAAQEVDLADPNIQAYVNYLVTVQVLTPERAAQILAASPA